MAVRRRLVRVALSLDDALAGRVPALGAVEQAEGLLVTSLPVAALADLPPAGRLVHIRQRYARHWIDLAAGEAAWRAALSADLRRRLRRKDQRLRATGAEVRRYATPAEIAAFHPLARAVSARTYQERLLDAGLPADPAPLLALAAADRVRAWLLVLDGAPIAYLCCTADGATLRYDHVGHDPVAASRSPGTVLLATALADLFGEGRWDRFDFTEGDGRHKRQLATGGVECVDLLLLGPTAANRALLAAMRGFDAMVAWAKRRVPRLRRLGR
ncbi:GNAT family N-acetyltransferase [uncultured Sphingomonas sp.]|uniref:GNAT family N-acetyltransferase n=1 Tax=uncultured Sphingomonas sp. TaxID=158754 RepID=UPI0035CAE792